MNRLFTIVEGKIKDTENTLLVGEDDCQFSDTGTIATVGIMSCLGVTIYSVSKKIGGLAHVTGRKDIDKMYHLENIVDTILSKMQCSPADRIQASYFGDGFRNEEKYLIVRKHLNNRNIPIIGQDVEPGFARRGFLNCENGSIEVYRNVPYQ